MSPAGRASYRQGKDLFIETESRESRGNHNHENRPREVSTGLTSWLGWVWLDSVLD